MKRFILLTAIFGLVSLSAVAQQQQVTLRTIKGYVFNAEGDAMPGATVKAVADSATTKSGADGTFSIEVTQFVKFLEASYEGYVSAQAEIDGTTIIFKLQVDRKYAANKAKAEKAALKAAKIEATEKAKAAEAARLAAEKEAARLAAEKEAARLAAEREVALLLAKQEAERLAAEKAKAEEEARLAAEKAKAEEEARLAAAKAKAEEEARLAAAKAKAEEEARIAAAKAKAEEEARLAAERVKAAEEARLAAEKALAEEKSRREAEKAQMNEQIRLAVEKALAEEKARTSPQLNSAAQTAPQSAVQQPIQQYAPQQPVQQYAPQQPVQQYAPQQPVQQYAPQQPVQQYAPQQPAQQPISTASNDEAQASSENKPKKELKKNRFGQVVEFGYFATTKNMNNIQRFDSAATLYYALGGSFVNNAIFFGVGTGIVYNFAGLSKLSEPVYGGGGSSGYPYENIGVLPLADLAIPAYLYFKANMAPKAKVSPFISLMGGAEIAPQSKTLKFRYGRTLSNLYQTPIFGRVQLGLSIRLSNRGAMYIGVGYRIDHRWGAYTKAGDSEVHPEYKNVSGFTANLGFTF
ncbi:MAG: hypothetical protein J6C94_06085 [Alistipes sp.]|nr:hypothetical protein [Alistipes sp.]